MSKAKAKATLTFLKPRKGLKVPNPKTGIPLPPEGKGVVLDAYWRRRLRDAEVIEIAAPKAAKGGES